MSEERTYTREQIKKAIYLELQRSNHLGEKNENYYVTIGIVMESLYLFDQLYNNGKKEERP